MQHFEDWPSVISSFQGVLLLTFPPIKWSSFCPNPGPLDISTAQFGSLQQLIVNILSPSGNTGCLPSLSPVLLRPKHSGTKQSPRWVVEVKMYSAEGSWMRLVSTLGVAGKSPGLGGKDGVRLSGVWVSGVSVSSAGKRRVGQHQSRVLRFCSLECLWAAAGWSYLQGCVWGGVCLG